MGKIFAGLIFLFFDVNLGSINILPDFVGYILIHLGMCQAEECKCWQNRQVTVGAIVFEIISWVLLLLLWDATDGAAAIALGVAGMALRLVVLRRVVRGAEELETASGIELGAEKLWKWWTVILVCSIAGYLLTWAATLAVIAGIVNLAASICFLVAWYRAWRSYKDERPNAI